jgi:hypothetical protein
MSTSRTYHYTTGNKLLPISASGCLLPTNVMVAPQEKPILWFSVNPVYEPTAVKLIATADRRVYRPTFQELHQIIGIFRFGIVATDARLVPFNKLQRLAHISSHDMAAMTASGMRIGATPAHWTGTLIPLALSELDFEEWTGDMWIPGSLPKAIEWVQNTRVNLGSKSAHELGLTNAY